MPGMDEKPQTPRPWSKLRPRFTLIGLLAFVTLCGFATQGFLMWRSYFAVRTAFERAQAVFDTGADIPGAPESSVEAYCRASERLCEAQCRLPLANQGPAKRAHLERMATAQLRLEMMCCMAPRPTRDDLVVQGYLARAERKLDDGPR